MKKVDNVWALLAILASGGLYAGLWSAGQNWGGDFAAYIMQAISIVEGTADEFVVRNAFTINESSWPMGPVAYPWGFPLLLAPIYLNFGMDLMAFKAVGLVFYVLFLLTLWFGFRHLLKPRELAVFVSLFAFNPGMLLFGDNIMSDFPFLFFSTLSIVVLGRLHHPKGVASEFASRLTLGLAMGAAFLIRTNGILLFVVYVSMAGIRAWRERRELIRGGGALGKNGLFFVAPLATFLLTIGLPLSYLPDGQHSHLGHLDKITLWFVLKNIVYYAQLLGEFFSPAPSFSKLGFVLYLLSLPFALAGIRSAWRESFPLLLYALLNLGLYIAWPYQQGLRFVFPLIPIYVYFLILGLRTLGKSVRRIGPFYILPLVGLSLAFALSSAYLTYSNLAQNRPVPRGPYTTHAIEMLDFIREHTSQDEVIIFRKPRVMRLFTARQALMIVSNGDVQQGDILVVDKNVQSFQLKKPEKEALLEEQKMDLVFANQEFEVYRLKKGFSRSSQGAH
jgi:hypothetical protein